MHTFFMRGGGGLPEKCPKVEKYFSFNDGGRPGQVAGNFMASLYGLHTVRR